MATIKDVARLAGVSAATVSYVLNDSAPVNALTRERVLAAIKALGYQPSQQARNFQRQRSMTLALVLPAGAEESGAEDVLSTCARAAARAGYALLVLAAADQAESALLADRAQQRGQADGCLLFDPLLPAPLMPHVWAVRPRPGAHGPVIAPDGARAARKAVAALLAHGSRRIGLILPPLETPGAGRWALGYRQSLRSAGLPFDTTLMAAPESASVAAGGAAAEALLQSGCDGLVTASAALAYGAAQAARSDGRTTLGIVAGTDSLLVAGAGVSALHWPIPLWGDQLVQALVAEVDATPRPIFPPLDPILIIRSP